MRSDLDRRTWISNTAALLTVACGGHPTPQGAAPGPAAPPTITPSEPSPMHTRTLPRTGESLPVIGLGTWSTFDVGDGEDDRAPLREVVRRFVEGGGRVVDSSPMYGRAEAVAGELLAEASADAFIATKVWTRGRDRGIAEMERSIQRLGHVDLMQVHNLLDVDAHMRTLQAWKAEGRIRYLGVTHYQRAAFDELETWIRSGTIDAVQLPYSVRMRDAEARLLPAAADAGCAVLVMRPFEEGALFSAVRGKPLPEVAVELGYTSWAQTFLAWILGHPAVTCPIPATANPEHMLQNLAAGRSAVPDAEQRARIAAAVG